MTIKMNTSIQMERYQWILPILEKRLTYDETFKLCPHSKRSLERWIAAYKAQGIYGLIPESTAPKTQPNETPIRLKAEVVSLRRATKLCVLKLHISSAEAFCLGVSYQGQGLEFYEFSTPCRSFVSFRHKRAGKVFESLSAEQRQRPQTYTRLRPADCWLSGTMLELF